MQQLLIATTNEGKAKEIKNALSDIPYTLISLNDIKDNIKDFDIEETGSSFEENALLKAIGYAEKTNLPTLADDSGLCFDALDGQPGIYTGRYSGHDAETGINKLLAELKGVPLSKRGAHYQSVVVFYNPTSNKKFVAQGRVNGKIVSSRKGDDGFGFDPIFYYPPFKKTFAEINTEEKNKISHRGKALQKIQKFLNSQEL